MTWKLFIDDRRLPSSVQMLKGIEFDVHATCSSEVYSAIKERGCPSFIAFDHDLGLEDEHTGKDIANWIIDRDLDGTYPIPPDFDYRFIR